MKNRFKWKEKYEYLGFELSVDPNFQFVDLYKINSKIIRVRRNSIDEAILENIYTNHCYDANMWFNRNLREVFIFKDVKYILDVGANIGIASCYFSEAYPEANVFAFEPEHSNYALLLKNTANITSIQQFNVAIWNNENGVYICNRDCIYGHSGKANPAKYEVGSKKVAFEKMVNSTSISKFIRQNNIPRIDILKIDIQGAEIEAFEDAELWLPHVRILFIELHDIFRRGCSKKIFEKISKYGNFIFLGSPNGDVLAFIKEEEICE